ncbi:hypothetical protein N8975_02285, partial [Candidatus Pelagibacter ubique]|nr:hypothetical protein [Candidatus Pelagibacter ubique]
MFKFYSIKKNQLSQDQIKEICSLKDSFWKHGLKSQLSWFKNNVHPEDINNLFYHDNKIIGYTLLKKRKVNF